MLPTWFIRSNLHPSLLFGLLFWDFSFFVSREELSCFAPLITLDVSRDEKSFSFCVSFCVRYTASTVLSKGSNYLHSKEGLPNPQILLVREPARGQICWPWESRCTNLWSTLWNGMLELGDIPGMSAQFRICRMRSANPKKVGGTFMGAFCAPEIGVSKIWFDDFFVWEVGHSGGKTTLLFVGKLMFVTFDFQDCFFQTQKI